MKTALVLSGGGMFGAWQVGAWRALAGRFQPDLVVGASVGSLNGYAIAAGASPEALAELWRRPRMGVLSDLPRTIRELMQDYPLTADYAVVLTDALRLKPRVVRNGDVTWRHLAASCAIPGVMRMYKLDSRWHCDGGLLNPLPVYAAAELGATHIVALNVLPQIPASWIKPFVAGFRRVAGHRPPLPATVELTVLKPPHPLGSIRDALRWKRQNVERWMEEGYCAGKNISISNCVER